ncbi:hypothetical protein GFC29_872 [Anoxybacillus sp. B7M1]|jgi:hypothetical protein|nr:MULTISPECIES: hypothetical protein [unclassified Anoxybacillus]ANB56498.1 hypothetical protein GFC28_754 [Anoxybacillus sp. B2M1]ANB63496.1 hypothetical protein GFC29_872 [Anoxybacillus sp. B7M1]
MEFEKKWHELTPLPFSKEEEQWLQEAMEYYMKRYEKFEKEERKKKDERN